MIYHISLALVKKYTFLNLFRYVSVRAIGAFLFSTGVSFFLVPRFIARFSSTLHSLVRENTPLWHQKKNDTPTMGGIVIIGTVVLTVLLWSDLSQAQTWIFLACILIFWCIGFFDDLSKIRTHKGLSISTKFALQLIGAGTVIALWYWYDAPNTELCIPFLKNLTPHLGIWLIPWGMLVLVATSNAVNLTDGLDGLATGPSIFSLTTFSLIAYVAGRQDFAAYLFIPFAHSAHATIFGGALIGTLMGFLWYNAYPAQIFMGDVGSLSLGAGLAFIALLTRQELLLLITGGLFVLEAVSVIIQVISYRIWKRRIFKMAPFHHHFEIVGWSEPKITVRFWIISILLSVLTLLTLKIR